MIFLIENHSGVTGLFRETTRNKEVVETNHVLRNAFDISIVN